MGSRRRDHCAAAHAAGIPSPSIAGTRDARLTARACRAVAADSRHALLAARYYLWLPRAGGMTTCEVRPCSRDRWSLQPLWTEAAGRRVLERSALIAFVDEVVAPSLCGRGHGAAPRSPAVAGAGVAVCLDDLVAQRRTIARVTCCAFCGSAAAGEAARLPAGWQRSAHAGRPCCVACADEAPRGAPQ